MKNLSKALLFALLTVSLVLLGTFSCSRNNGTNCTVRDLGLKVLISCQDGSQSMIDKPLDGRDGVDGEDGLPGLPGANAQMVQLCPGDTAPYPEQGLKIGTKLYAVYWDGGQAWLAYLTPGSYRTTNGSACYFTVDADGNTF